MASLNDFLNWFAGYAENIEKAPTAKQWQRIVAKVEELNDARAAGEPERAVANAPSPPQPRGDAKPTTATAWKAQYQGALIEGGCDEETAKDFVSEVKVDLSTPPKEAAADTLASLGIATTH